MATLDELRLTQLLQPFEGPSGIATLNPLAFQYQNPQYPNSTQMFYQPRTDISATQDFYEPSLFPPTSYGFINTPQSYYPPNNLSATQDFYQPRMDVSATQDFYQPRQFVNAPQNYYQPDLTTLRGLDMNRFQGVSDMSVIDETTNDEQDQNYINQVNKNKSTGIMDLIMSIAVPGYGFLKNISRGGLEGIRGLNQRIQQSDFGRSKTLADYFDAKSYGGIDARNRAAQQNMREARAIQTQVDRRGDSTSRVADRNRSSVTTASAAKSKGVGGGGYTKSDSTRDSFRGRY